MVLLRRAFNALLVLLAACSLLCMLGRWFWWADLATHFRITYLITLGVLALALFSDSTRYRLPLVALLIAYHGAVVLTVPQCRFSAGHPNSVERGRLRVVSVNMLATNRQYRDLIDWLKHANPDVVAIQELTEAGHRAMQLWGKYPYGVFHPSEDVTGIGIYSRRPIRRHQLFFESQGWPAIAVEIDWEDAVVEIISMHSPPPMSAALAAMRNEQFDAIAGYIRSKDMPCLLIGDFNCSPWSPWFARLLVKSGLKDGREGFGIQATWPQDTLLPRIPIDHSLVSRHWTVLARFLGHRVGSDHLPVLVDLSLR